MKFCLLLMARYCISITDEKGVAENLVVTKSTESFEETFEVLQEGHKDWGTLAIAAPSITNDVRVLLERPKLNHRLSKM